MKLKKTSLAEGEYRDDTGEPEFITWRQEQLVDKVISGGSASVNAILAPIQGRVEAENYQLDKRIDSIIALLNHSSS